ncbi:MAG: hypothetical protein Fur0037_27850 [Planctomycetota bacterium]
MAQLQIVCDNCGAKYRLPETFTGPRAKCKQCQGVIDVASQREAAAGIGAGAAGTTEPAARPAAARPARAAGAEKTAPQRASESSARRSRRGGDEDGARRGRGQPEKNNTGILIASAVLLVAIAGGAIWWLTRPQSSSTETASNSPTEAKGSKEALSAADANASKAGAKQGQPKADAPLSEQEMRRMIGDAGSGTGQPAKTAQPAAAANPASEPAKLTLDKVFDPKTLTPVPWPDAVPEAQRTHIVELIDQVQGGGKPGISAKEELVKIGWASFAGIVNRLREIDYKDSEQSMLAFELNKILETITISLNTGFKVVNLGEEVAPEVADHNARTAKAWQGLMKRFPTPESLEEHRKKALADKRK